MEPRTLSPQISFIINTWEDWPYAIELLAQIRQHYPKATTLVIADGVNPKPLQEACDLHGARLHKGKRLKHLPSNDWSDRMFRLAKALPGDYIVKIDPDCLLNRPITLPEEPFDIAARLYGQTRLQLIGPCIVFSREAVERIWRSGLLKGEGKTYKGRSSGYSGRLHSQDLLLHKIVEQLGLKQVRLLDAAIDWISPAANPEAWAVVHPRADAVPLIGWRCSLSTDPKNPTIGRPVH